MIMQRHYQAAHQRRRPGRRARSMGWTHTGPSRISRRAARSQARSAARSRAAYLAWQSGPYGTGTGTGTPTWVFVLIGWAIFTAIGQFLR